ncbi:MAG: DNA polymerase III subunit beta [Butyricicoccus sp.]|nr:DNA polymerase III subunit beta [Butyricicoccus sp.]
MQFTCEKNGLLKAISIASRAAVGKSPNPALEGILIESGAETVRFTCYDLTKAIYTDADAQVSEPGSILLPARLFESMVRKMPSGDVSVKTGQGSSVSVSCGRTRYEITGLNAGDFPVLPSVDSQAGVSLPENILGCMIRQTIFAVSDNENRPLYTGELFEISGGSLTVVAVDGYRLALRREKLDSEDGEYSFIVPGKSLAELEKLCSDSDDPVRITLGEKHISFAIDRTVLISRRLDGDFLNYRKAVPTEFAITVFASRAQIYDTVDRVALTIDDRLKNPLRCVFDRDFVKMTSTSAIGSSEDFCAIDGDGKGLLIGFNNRYLLDILKDAPADELKICLNNGSSPCVMTAADEENDSFLYMLLPVRLKAE